uniref:Vacuolar protein sorting-associated protein 33A n=1 Tax=Plectus sambesii TaxID=2011161 RepID=A0A914VNX1_9BILA
MTPSAGPTSADSLSAPSAQSSGRVTMSHMRDANRRMLFDFLRTFDGSKAIVWDGDLTKQFTLIAGFSELKEHGVARMFPLKAGQAAPQCDVEHVLYMTRTSTDRVRAIIDNVRGVRQDDRRRHHAVFVPDSSTLCRHKLKEAGVHERLESVKELAIRFYSTDADVATLLAPRSLPTLLTRADWSPLHEVALALDQLETVFGQATRVHYMGDWAKKTVELLGKKREQDAIARGHEQTTANQIPLIDDIIVIDRWIDPLTPLITQLTYEGLIDELFGIRYGTALFPKDRFFQKNQEKTSSSAAAAADNKTKKVALTSSDDLFTELRNLNFNAVGLTLSKHIKYLSEQTEERHKAITVRECKEFVKRLPELEVARDAAGLHTTIAELIKESTTSKSFLDTIQCEQEILNCLETERPMPYIEEAIAKGEPFIKVLRLICMHSLVSDGLKAKVLDQYRRELLQSYGHEYADTLVQVQRAGLIRERGEAGSRGIPLTYLSISRAGQTAAFPALNKAFRLLVSDVNEKSPNDASYVYSGYAPLTVRLCQYWLNPGWRSPAVADPMKRVPGATGVVQRATDIGPGRSVADGIKRSVLVFFIGGVTYAEISALRFLSSKDENYEFLIASTHILNGDSMLTSLNDE